MFGPKSEAWGNNSKIGRERIPISIPLTHFLNKFGLI